MSNYSANDQNTVIAQSCNRFSMRKRRGAADYRDNTISCDNCRNWNGIRCKTSIYDDIMTNLDLNYFE